MSEKSQSDRQNFAKSYRLSCSKDYQFVFQSASKASDKLFLILSRKNNSSQARLGLAVAKKHARLAVQRNRIKRIIRESFRKQNAIPAVDIVVMIRPAAVKANNQQLSASLKQLWKKL